MTDKSGAGRRHAFTVDESQAKVVRDGGSRVDVTAAQFPILNGMALATLTLEPNGVREPHWHPNAAELNYCTEGSARFTIVEPGGNPVVMNVEKGDTVFVPMGFLHGIENTSDGETRFLLCFSHERYEDLNLSTSLNNMPAHVLDASFGVERGTFDWVAPTSEAKFIARQQQRPSPAKPPLSRYRYQLERMDPQVQNAGGFLRFARRDDWPILDGLAMYSLWFTGKTVREPHWHPNCSELNYLLNGRVRVTIVSPGGDVDDFELVAGEISYIPQAYFHHIESLADEDVHMCVFFNHELPMDNGITAAVSGYSPELLAAVFELPSETFASLPKFPSDVLLAPPAPSRRP